MSAIAIAIIFVGVVIGIALFTVAGTISDVAKALERKKKTT